MEPQATRTGPGPMAGWRAAQLATLALAVWALVAGGRLGYFMWSPANV